MEEIMLVVCLLLNEIAFHTITFGKMFRSCPEIVFPSLDWSLLTASRPKQMDIC